ncbi:hypothetical protein Mfla_2515 [Methylobacillus flagellatus KT]|uniref:Uncharacterized protein n=1 Tax=Methylobacillus flagellatus (strain ATCC 51484 / DSM 6875 / VKM B-1610 / KT) TaxID=265072 RepID=Q1GYA7_METFK|nr:hypothetical protein Mfla_2515 [Methylobacillus flagellatus KT]
MHYLLLLRALRAPLFFAYNFSFLFIRQDDCPRTTSPEIIRSKCTIQTTQECAFDALRPLKPSETSGSSQDRLIDPHALLAGTDRNAGANKTGTTPGFTLKSPPTLG